ncbi:MAG: hypothetical protein MK105_14395 [Crocinitomicaceae bacterium]|nr:hypothetical protein [Crocinitomicaceae bacterium]
MRKLVYTLIAVLGFTAMSFGQGSVDTAKTSSHSDLAASKESGHYIFTFPASVSEEQVKKSASYYTKMFTTSYDKNTHDVSFDMVENTSANRTVMTRMMLQCGVKFVMVEDETLKLYDFVQNYLK